MNPESTLPNLMMGNANETYKEYSLKKKTSAFPKSFKTWSCMSLKGPGVMSINNTHIEFSYHVSIDVCTDFTNI